MQVVNVLVTPEQAEVLSLISNDMRIQLILRNPLDTKETKTSGTAAANIFSGVAYKGPAGRSSSGQDGARAQARRRRRGRGRAPGSGDCGDHSGHAEK